MIVTNERFITVTSDTGPRGYEITIQVHQSAPQSLRRPDAYELWRYLGLVLGEYVPRQI